MTSLHLANGRFSSWGGGVGGSWGGYNWPAEQGCQVDLNVKDFQSPFLLQLGPQDPIH